MANHPNGRSLAIGGLVVAGGFVLLVAAGAVFGAGGMWSSSSMSGMMDGGAMHGGMMGSGAMGAGMMEGMDASTMAAHHAQCQATMGNATASP